MGRVPLYPGTRDERYPGVSSWESIEHIGPMSRTVADSALMLSVIAGPDDRDRFSLPHPDFKWMDTVRGDLKGKRIAYSPSRSSAATSMTRWCCGPRPLSRLPHPGSSTGRRCWRGWACDPPGRQTAPGPRSRDSPTTRAATSDNGRSFSAVKVNSAWRLAICVAALMTAEQAAAYPNCENDPSLAAVFIATRMANNEELDKLYDYHFVRALQRQMTREVFADLSRSIDPARRTQSSRRVVLTKPIMQEIDQSAVRQFTRLSGEAVGASFEVLSGASAGATELFLSLQCADGEWKVTRIEVRKTDKKD